MVGSLAAVDVRERLRQILKTQGILYSTPGEPIRHRDGQIAPWAFYSWNATLTAEGLRLAALHILERLSSFESRQIAAYGHTAQPLMAACVLLGGGRYTGLCIREQRKLYLAGRQIDGPADRNASVVVVDDSLSSGRSLSMAIDALENNGFRVEGAIALVHFPGRGGLEWARNLGYRVETLFDVWTDLEMNIPERAAWTSLRRLEDGLHPTLVARQVARAYLSGAGVPEPPRQLDRDYDGQGGVFVSFRRRDTDVRVGRDGFWHFPGEPANPPADVVLATVRALQAMRSRELEEHLEQLKIGVTFFGALEPIRPAQLDFDRYGIVVRGIREPSRMGGALPNTEVFTSEVEQYLHARDRNARLGPYESHTLYRHTVHKVVEPGATWPPYGQPDGPEMEWTRDPRVGEALSRRARNVLSAVLESRPIDGDCVSEDLIPVHGDMVAVTLYHRGFIGYGVAEWTQAGLDLAVVGAVQRACRDPRFVRQRESTEPSAIDLVVAVAHSPERLGTASLELVKAKVRPGLDSLRVVRGDRSVVALASSVPYNNWSRDEFVERTLASIGPGSGATSWATYKTASWLRSGESVYSLTSGFPIHGPDANWLATIELLGQYLVSNSDDTGRAAYYLEPLLSRVTPPTLTARTIHALLALDEAGRVLQHQAFRKVAHIGLSALVHTLEGHGGVGGPLAECALLVALANAPDVPGGKALADKLAARIGTWFGADGRVCPDEVIDDQIFLPGAALWAYATYHAARGSSPPLSLQAQLVYYRQQFRARPEWGAVGWQMQSWGALYAMQRQRNQAEFVFELADWAIDRQLEKNGVFLEELTHYGPSFNTGFIGEGMAAAWATANKAGDMVRAERYAASWRAAMGWLRQLLILPEDTFCMLDPTRAVGGVRASPARSDVRVDFVSHYLHALTSGPHTNSTR